MFVFAHRGASGEAPENTLTAVEIALQQQADGVEIDVRQHGDQLLVIHDNTLERTTNGKGSLDQHSFDDLRKLDAGNGQKIPTLQEIMACIAGKVVLNIEVKSCYQIELLNLAYQQAIGEYNFQPQQLLVSSFDHHILQELRQLNSYIALGALTATKPIDYAAVADTLQARTVNADAELIDRAFVLDAHHRGLPIYAYTVNNAEEMLRLKAMGVDGIFTNYPALAKRVLA